MRVHPFGHVARNRCGAFLIQRYRGHRDTGDDCRGVFEIAPVPRILVNVGQRVLHHRHQHRLELRTLQGHGFAPVREVQVLGATDDAQIEIVEVVVEESVDRAVRPVKREAHLRMPIAVGETVIAPRRFALARRLAAALAQNVVNGAHRLAPVRVAAVVPADRARGASAASSRSPARSPGDASR